MTCGRGKTVTNKCARKTAMIAEYVMMENVFATRVIQGNSAKCQPVPITAMVKGLASKILAANALTVTKVLPATKLIFKMEPC